MLMNDIITQLRNAEKIAILPHVSVDGDALGSSLALGLALKKLGRDIIIYTEEEVPDVYSFLPGLGLARIYGGEDVRYDLAVVLDTGDLQRLGRRVDIFNTAAGTINIDHHSTNTGFAVYNHVSVVSSSVGEIIYQILKMMGFYIDSEMALCLYVAISTDTGGFRYSNTTQLTHQIAADLVSSGVDVAETSRRIFETVSVSKVRLAGRAINSLQLFEEEKVALLVLTEEDIRSTGAKDEDCDGIVNIARNIKGVEVGVLLRQRENDEIRVNLRSNAWVDVAQIAKIFGGGGHKRAAGFTVNGRVDDVKEKVMREIRDALRR